MKKNNPKISVIVPIYNVSEYLNDCISDIIEFINVDYELILVNDGSTDNSLEICNKYKNSNSNITIVDKFNGGLSSARNAGIEAASGKYIVFIDPDDRLDKLYFEKLINIAEEKECDGVVSGYTTVPTNVKVCPGYTINELMNGVDFVLSTKNIHSNNDLCFVWRNIYRLDVIKENNLKFNEKVFIGEDVIFNLEFFLKSKRLYAIGDSLYFYRVNNPNSLMRSKYKPNLESSLIEQYNIRKKISLEYSLLNNSGYKKDMANYYIRGIYPMIITNLKNDNRVIDKKVLSKIINYPMITENTKIIGLKYSDCNIKEYIYYLAIKFKMCSILAKAIN